jgi:glycerol-3-phosphate dehydrogenase (NAD(P)+)
MSAASSNITILGAGLWGSALASLADRNQHGLTLWSRRSTLPFAEAIAKAEIILSAVSMAGVRPMIEQLQQIAQLPEDVILVTATKGLDPLTYSTPYQLWHQAFPAQPLVVLSGPNLSKEIRQGLPAATVVASNQLAAAQRVQECLASDYFRVYINADPLGTELGGTLKNVMAIASGVCDGLNLGTNAKAALLTRALPEMIRISRPWGAKPDTFFGLSGLGDLLATCNSPLSRNYQVGYGLAQGKSLAQVLAEIEGTAEGINTTQVLHQFAAQRAIAAPITDQVFALLSGEITPASAVQALMRRDLKSEFDDLELKLER